MEEAPELISPRISFSHDLATVATPPAPPSRRSDTSLLVSCLPEPEFAFANANAAAADVSPADRLFAGGKLLPVPPLPPPPKPNPSKQQTTSGSRVKAQAWQQKRPGSWASPFSRSSSVNSATTTGAPRSAGRFGCPSFPLMRSRSAGSAAVARDGLGNIGSDAGAHRTRYKKVGAAASAAASNVGSSRVYYYGGSRKGSSHGVRVSPVLNVPFIGTSVMNLMSYLLCDCSSKTTKNRGNIL
ncbi:uncharacterized protein LOC133910317 [Phragmites australis]|uniref:uncharacterized protein LOC133910317 n=1 Tax=Phragmites australis TaxID=29695 RepID=UPI002D77F81B|nr:uncharacterized protein LOC133910317 [Phragmites australis]